MAELKIAVFLYCEGTTDYAVFPVFMKKCLPNLEIRCIKKDELKRGFRTHRKNKPLTGSYRNIKALAGIASRSEIKNIAYHQDADRKYDEVYRAIEYEFKPLRTSGFCCLAIVPKEMTESWLLSDVKAINLLGDGIKNVSQSPNPENLWGNEDDPNSNHPKKYLNRNLEELGLDVSQDNIPRFFAQIAENTDIDVLTQRCPKSFGQFRTDMQTFISDGVTP